MTVLLEYVDSPTHIGLTSYFNGSITTAHVSYISQSRYLEFHLYIVATDHSNIWQNFHDRIGPDGITKFLTIVKV